MEYILKIKDSKSKAIRVKEEIFCFYIRNGIVKTKYFTIIEAAKEDSAKIINAINIGISYSQFNCREIFVD